MHKVGILTEKPSACKNFATAFGGRSGSYNGETYVLGHARGHLYEFKEPHEQVPSGMAANYRAWALENLPWDESLFKWVKEPREGVTKAELSDLKKLFSDCDELVVACDLDPSGSGAEIAVSTFLELGLRPKKWSRMYFVDESPASIQKAFRERKVIPDLAAFPEYRKSLLRNQFDFLTIQFTRVAKCLTGSLLRQGRLKSAMVVLVGDQLAALEAYKKNKQPYYQNRFRDENGVVYTNPEEPCFRTREEVPGIYQASAVVVDGKERKTSAPPKLLNLSNLASILEGRGYKAKEVTDTYQKMYEYTTPFQKIPGVKSVSGVLSYPRSEDVTITPEQFSEMLPCVDAIARVVGVDIRILTHRTARKTHVKEGGAHGANRPGTNVPQSLDDLRQFGASAPAIYELLAKSFLAMFCEDYQYELQKGHLADYPRFTGKASVPVSPGWKAVMAGMDDPDEDENAKGLGTRAEVFVYEGFPPKPATPTMKWLMKQLEKRNVGTPATQVSTYNEVTGGKAPLIKATKGRLDLSDQGRMSYLILPGTNIGSLDLTEKVWTTMKEVENGKDDGSALLHAVGRMVAEDIETMKRNLPAVQKEFPDAKPVSSGGSDGSVPKKEKATGRYKGKKEVSFSVVWSGHRFTDKEIEDLLAGKEISFEAVSAKTGKSFTARGSLKEQTYNGHKFWGFKADFGR